ncbi:hypothetical protein [Methylobacterium sp. ID0610]|uniref:hypothetical protein n=1 Tax=Methylobacterium carpenticola TaxID=3344827 RepID=UPI0036AEBF7A
MSTESPPSNPDGPAQPAATHGATIRWSSRGHGTAQVTTGGYATREEATAAAVRIAMEKGWTPPRWWQFWRWRDRRS